MTIAIDCRHIDSSGVGVYSRETLPFFLQSKNRFLLIGNTEKLAAFITGCTNAELLECNIRPFSLRELCSFPSPLLKKINTCDCFYSPFFNIPGGITVPVYTTIHDIIFPDMPELTSKAGLALRMWFYRRAFNRSKKIFTVSEFSKSRIEHYSAKKTSVIVTHIALQPYLTRPDNTAAAKKDYILFIGNIKKHKGLRCLLDAFFLARGKGLWHKLIIVGNKDNFRSADTELASSLNSASSSDIEFTGQISDEQLKTLLCQAALLVQPSLYEGFGLPPLEAMTCGTQALISDIPVFKEIYGGFPVTFFRAGDSEDLAHKLLALLCDKPPLRITLSEDLANKYTFQKTASIILAHITLTL